MQLQEHKDFKKSITHFLLENKAYDCLPANSRVPFFDKNLPFLKASRILKLDGLTQAIIYDPDLVNPLWMFSARDDVSFLLTLLRDYFREGGQRLLSEPENQAFWTRAERVSLGSYVESQGQSVFPKKAVSSRLSEIIFKMNSERVNRIALVERDSKMVTGIITYLDILQFLIRTMNMQVDEQHEYNLKIGIPLQRFDPRPDIFVLPSETLLAAFEVMVVDHKKLFLQVRNEDGSFCDLLFRDDFWRIIEGRDVNVLLRPVSLFLPGLREQKNRYLQFTLSDTLNLIVEKLTLSKYYTLVCLDANRKLQEVLGLSELFCLYI